MLNKWSPWWEQIKVILRACYHFAMIIALVRELWK